MKIRRGVNIYYDDNRKLSVEYDATTDQIVIHTFDATKAAVGLSLAVGIDTWRLIVAEMARASKA